MLSESFRLELSEDEIRSRIQHCLEQGWLISIEHIAKQEMQSNYWEPWGVPLSGFNDPGIVMQDIAACRDHYPNQVIRITAFLHEMTQRKIATSFIVYTPGQE